MSSERDLWAAVLTQAIQDLMDSRTDTELLNSTRLWFVSDDYEPGSFLWICDSLELEPTLIRHVALQPNPTEKVINRGR
jgi:hypothetical protein